MTETKTPPAPPSDPTTGMHPDPAQAETTKAAEPLKPAEPEKPAAKGKGTVRIRLAAGQAVLMPKGKLVTEGVVEIPRQLIKKNPNIAASAG